MLLKVGSSGSDVKKIQEKLGIRIDGVYGYGTENAVKVWQSKNGLSDDGVVGPKTWDKMFNITLAPPKPKDTSDDRKPFDISKLSGEVPDEVLSQIPEIMEKFQINNKLRICHFLAQCAHESGDFKAVTENLNYSVDGLLEHFGKYFKGRNVNNYARSPEKIGNLIYGGRMGNGVETTGDGYKYRGRGYIQLTGKDNYREFSKMIGVDVVSDPTVVATTYPLASAAFYFSRNGLNIIADKGATLDVITQITKRVNGGIIGLNDRIKHFNIYYNLLS